MAATDAQMQQFSDQRVRVRAEVGRLYVAQLRDDKAAIDAVYDRAANGAAWADNRTGDAPPKLATGQDILTYNSVATLLLKCVDGTATLQDVADLHANWPVFQSMCVRPFITG